MHPDEVRRLHKIVPPAERVRLARLAERRRERDMASGRPPLTWGQVKEWAQANGIKDDALVVDQNYRLIRDLSEAETAGGQPALRLQTIWG